MKSQCAKWKEQLLDAALEQTENVELERHLQTCSDCARELATLRMRQEKLDDLLPLLLRGVEPPPEFRARLLAAAEAGTEPRGLSRGWLWCVGGGVSALLVAILISGPGRRTAPTVTPANLAAAEALVHWRAPTDVLLDSHGPDILKDMPRVGGSYLERPLQQMRRK
jgi:anti-sigma factor RsiW